MTGKRLEGLDLNLLLALHWLLAERNVTAASVKLGLSQPAASRALGRLRDIFDDPLLVKVGGEMSPTPLAERIQPQLAHAIDRCRDVLRVSGEFRPAEQAGRFRMACPDYIGVLASSIWHDFVRPEAPQMSLDLLTPTLETARDMVTGRIDMCVLPDIVALDLPASVDPESFV
ncbi:MAG: LysR family transcriptional regulator, partial [Parvularcula sp.]